MIPLEYTAKKCKDIYFINKIIILYPETSEIAKQKDYGMKNLSK